MSWVLETCAGVGLGKTTKYATQQSHSHPSKGQWSVIAVIVSAFLRPGLPFGMMRL